MKVNEDIMLCLLATCLRQSSVSSMPMAMISGPGHGQILDGDP